MNIIYIVFLSVLLTACYNPTMKIDARSALEQELTRGAIFRAVYDLPILKNVLDGRWRIVVVSPDRSDDSWTRAVLRQRLAGMGADISSNDSENISLIEVMVQFASSDIDIDNFILGIPIPGTKGSSSVSFYHENTQRGRTKIQLNFWSYEGKLLAMSPAVYGETHYSDVTVLTFIGRFSFTDLNDIKTFGRFMEKGADEWNKTVHVFTKKKGTTSNIWINPDL